MIPVIDAASAASPHPEATARQGFFRRCLSRLGNRSGFALTMFGMETPHAQRLTAQEQAAGQIALLMIQRHALMAEKDRLSEQRAKAARQRKRLSAFDARLKEITHELLKVGP